MLRDSCGRVIDYLRLSVTDRCNLRCLYCRPAGTERAPAGRDRLSDDETVRLVRCFASLGIGKVRVTGGEPLTRPGLETLLSRLAGEAGVRGASLSTNGVLLGGRAGTLARAGLARVNISLDTLKDDRFSRIAGAGSLQAVMGGIRAALEAGLDPVKINVVVARGLNDDEIPDFVRLSREMPLHVRFIELMPLGETGFFNRERWVSIDEVRRLCGTLEPLSPAEVPEGSGPAEYYRAPGGRGTVGFIGAVTRGFCGRCNRVRLTSDGKLLLCLAQDGPGTDLGALVRSGASSEELEAVIRKAVLSKPAHHRMSVRGPSVSEARMCLVGG